MSVATNASLTLAPPRISDRTLVRVQAASGLLFAVFLVLHLSSAVVALLGQSAYDAYLGAMRWYYQFPLVEILCVLGAASVHMVAGVMRIWRRARKRRRARAAGETSGAGRPSWRVRLHRYTGYYILLFFVGHVLATRGLMVWGETAADFSYVNFSLVNWGGYFYPYYLLLAFSGFYHLTHGAIAGLRALGVRVPRAMASPRSRGFWLWIAVAVVLTVLAVLALGGNFYDVDQHRFGEWRELYSIN